MDTISSTLKAVRIAQGLSLQALADLLHVHASYICRVEQAKRRPSPAYLYEYARALGVDAYALLEHAANEYGDADRQGTRVRYAMPGPVQAEGAGVSPPEGRHVRVL
jgi:transcriptional regulator with XRE-family HTH domain